MVKNKRKPVKNYFENTDEFWKATKKETFLKEEDKTLFIFGSPVFFVLVSILSIPLSFLFTYLFQITNSIVMLSIHFILTIILSIPFVAYFVISRYPKKQSAENASWGILIVFGGLEVLALIFIFESIKLWLPIIVLSFILMEVLFWFDKQQPTKKDNTFWFTVKVKLEKLGLAILSIFLATSFALACKNVIDSINLSKANFWQITETVGIIAIIVVAFVVFIWINSLKYKNKVKK